MTTDSALRLMATRPALLASVLTLCFSGVLFAAEAPSTSPTVSAVRLGVDAEQRTRIVLDMDERPSFSVTPTADGTIIVRVNDADFPNRPNAPSGLVSGISLHEEGLTLALAEPALPVTSFILPPSGDVRHFRLVIDLAGVAPEAFVEAVSVTPPSAVEAPVALAAGEGLMPSPSLKPRGEDERPAAASAKMAKIIVIDPGHGGYDPGASGPNGYREEAATLEAAKTLRTVLTARGYEVLLTREDDSFVPLEERIETARRAHADLFLSLHADAHEDPSLRGASVYTLSEKRSARMAAEAKGSGDFVLYDVALSEDERDVGAILFDLANETTRNESARLASSLVDELSGTVPMVNNTHRKGSLKVLLAADVPAVLVEMAFISNAKDEANLASPRWRRTAMGAVADGIDGYFAERVASRQVEAGPPGG